MRCLTSYVIVFCLLAISVAVLAGLAADASAEAAAVINQPMTEDADAGSQELSDERAAAIVLFWIVSFVLFFVGIKRLIQFWAIVLVLASLGVVMPIEDVLMSIVVFFVVLGTLMWMGVREIFGGWDC